MGSRLSQTSAILVRQSRLVGKLEAFSWKIRNIWCIDFIPCPCYCYVRRINKHSKLKVRIIRRSNCGNYHFGVGINDHLIYPRNVSIYYIISSLPCDLELCVVLNSDHWNWGSSEGQTIKMIIFVLGNDHLSSLKFSLK